MNPNTNIFFLLEDVSVKEQDNYDNIQKMLDEINEVYNENTLISENSTYYDTCTVKELIKICQYYDITKNSKIVKGKKQDLINAIVWFENAVENYAIVQQRHQMWLYIKELNNDPKMKKYLLWI
jgi:hypothetical protein